ncbi:hypothetical protein PN838_18290 [Psychrosphaera sp. G1-22]|uniref:Uncharacterized protein n=1 Tax=Psychrosphaera algicola TaxID=3023714 RepID=A0ABT5FFQ6_9GAMM|nr:hypothetical protein [Psychrosphaera sp. G1-22]MDC2890348.1 hypothetical protein [Psychrosphaera sp. G1-22]
MSPFANVVYYGEEIGLQQVLGNEHELQRAIMPWDDTSELGFSSDGQFWLDEHKWFPWKKSSPDWSGEYSALFHQTSVLAQEYNGSILDTYRKMLLLKSTDEVLTDIQEYEILKGEPKLWWVKYKNQSGTRFVVTNLSPIKKMKVQIPQNQNAKYVDLISNQLFEPNTEFWLEHRCYGSI